MGYRVIKCPDCGGEKKDCGLCQGHGEIATFPWPKQDTSVHTWCEERQAKAVQRGGLPSEATIEGEVSDGD